VEIDVEIVRFVSDEPQPGLVECVLVDAYGASHSIIEKTAISSTENLTAVSVYPRPGVIAGEVRAEWEDETGRRLARVDTKNPWGIEAVDGTSSFVVLASVLRKR
jgi:hypothetical protein